MAETSRTLTLDEARQRAGLLTVAGYDVHLDVTGGPESFRSLTKVRFSSNRPGATTFAELRATRLIRATLNGRPLAAESLAGNRLTLPDLIADNELIVEADLPYSNSGEGMHRYVDPLDGETYVGAYLGIDNAQRVFACFDQPDLKAPFVTTVTAPVGWTVVGNGRRQSAVNGRWTFASTPPLSTYLFVVVAGPLHSVEIEHRGTPFRLHCRRSLAPHLDREAGELLAVTTACFDRYRELFDEPYAFDSYDSAFVPELHWGAMESPGCVTFRDSFVFTSAVTRAQRQERGMVIAHEMAHMWFGDLVTMRWWDDLWLSESFAEYMGYQVLSEATDFGEGWTAFAMSEKTWGYDADQRPSTHPVAAHAADVADTESAMANFDGISYAKGASAIRQLVTWLGQETFLAGVNDFLTLHRYGVATLEDLLEALSRASGEDVRGWSAGWLRTTGVDVLRVVRDGGLAVEHPGRRVHQVSVALYDRGHANADRAVLRRRTQATLAQDTTSTPVELTAGEPAPELVLINDDDTTYAKVRFDATSWSVIADGLSTLATGLSRAVVWTAARDAVRDAELPVGDYLALVEAHLPAEDDVAIAQAVLRFAREQVVDRYLDPTGRPAALAGLATACRSLLDRAHAAGDDGLRLAAVRALISVSARPDEVAVLRAALTARQPTAWPALDPDLRWRVLLRLSVLGELQPADIEAELVDDTSGRGPEGAARCRAALPTPEAKAAAWEAVFGTGPQASAYLISATLSGFWQPEHRDLLAPWVPRWFPAAVELASRRGPGLAATVGRQGFPSQAVDVATLDAGEECLSSGDPNAALRRQLVDQLDDLRRALRVRAAQAAPQRA